jgi:fused signal recognition particle receptor
LTSLEPPAKGGVIVAICRLIDLPVKYVGVGESADDLVVFEPIPFVDALFEE